MLARHFVSLLALAAGLAAQPVLNSISPDSAPAGSGSLVLTLNGSGFSGLNIVRWESQSLTTTFVNTNRLQATVPATLLTTPGSFNVRVRTSVLGNVLSNALPFVVTNPAPTLSSISPTLVQAGLVGASITLSGTNFVPATVARFQGTALPTTFVSATSLTATLSASQLAASGTFAITAQSPAPGGGTTSSRTLTVQAPVPTLSQISPDSGLVGSAPVALSLTGVGFLTNSVVRWNGTNLPTIHVSNNLLNATVSASLLTAAGTAEVTVFTPSPGGGASQARSFTVENPPPSLSGLIPSSLPLLTAPTVVTLQGSGFVATSSVRATGGTIYPTNFLSSTALEAIIPGPLNTAITLNLVVQNPAPGGGTSGAAPLMLLNPAPVLTSVSPTTVPVLTSPTTVTLQGSGFVASSLVKSTTGTVYPTNVLSDVAVEATITTPLNTLGSINLVVENPAPGGGTSAPSTLSFSNVTPTIGSIAPAQLTALDPTSTITITGSGFHDQTRVYFNSLTVPLTILSFTSQQIVATLAANFIQVPDLNGQILVTNGPNGTGPQVTFPFPVTAPTITIASISPSTLIAGALNPAVQILGQNFYLGTVVLVNGNQVATTRLSSTHLRIFPAQSLVNTVGTVTLQVRAPNPLNLSNVATLQIIPPTLLSVSPSTIAALPASAPPLTLTLTGIGFAPSTTNTFVYADGVFLQSLVFSDTLITCQLSGLVAGRAREGGIAISVTNGFASPSNTIGLRCGTSDNLGTVNINPVRILDGQPFSVLVEGGVPLAPFSLIADVPPAEPLVLATTPPQVLGVLQTTSVALIDGLGILGPAAPFTLSAAGTGTPPGGQFTLPGFVAPASPVGAEIALQAAYLDPSSPIGLRLTWTFAPLRL